MAQEFDEKAVFLAALALPPGERGAYLRSACPDDAARARIEHLLLHHVRSTELFSASPGQKAPGAAGAGGAGAGNAGGAGASLPPPPAEQVDEFRILAPIEKGGMGVVYLAHDTILDRKVALKFLAPHLVGSEQALARFREEARSAAALRHPAIVPVYKFGFDGARHYLASEYVEGSNLAAVIEQERERRKTTTSDTQSKDWGRRCAEIVRVIANALEASHAAGIIHRDVKPGNILIDNAHGPRLTDFGIAKHLTEEGRTFTGAIGSVHYMSPEQASIAGARVDQRSDIFSLGVVLYEMLSLRRPFDGGTVEQILKAVASAEPTRLRSLDPRIPRDLETICHKALEKDPSRRYQTAAHMGADLRCFLEGRPILARPEGMSRRSLRWARRHRVAAVSVLVPLLAAGTITATTLYVQARRAAMGRMVVPESMRGAVVTAIPYRADLSQGAPIRLGRAPLAEYLPSGLYRVVITLPDQQRVETPSFLTRGFVDVIEVSPPDAAYLDRLVEIPANTYPLGERGPEAAGSLIASRGVRLEPFLISRTEATNKEYREFVLAMKARGVEIPAPKTWADPYDAKDDPLPITAITWDEAVRYCRWRGVRLPTPNEWEAAARGLEGRPYAWGNQPNSTLAQIDSSEEDRKAYLGAARPVDSDPGLATPAPFSLCHMSSNVQEYSEGVAADRNFGIIVMGRSWRTRLGFPISRFSTAPTRDVQASDRGFRIAASPR